MKSSIITVKTMTIGLKAKKLLSSHGVKAVLIKIDHTSSETGCSYGLELPDKDFYNAIALLRDHGIEYGVYRQK